MADVAGTLRSWSGTAGSNNPTQATTIGSGLSDNLQTMQAVVRKYLASYGSNIATAATMDLTTMDGYVASVTGNTTVTGLGTEAAGVSYWLVFASTPMFKNGSNLILGGSDITFAAGDVARFTAEGSGVARLTEFYPTGGTTGTGGFVRSTSPTITTAALGSSTATTQTAGDASTKLATTAYVDRGTSGASMVFLASKTASNSASLSFTSSDFSWSAYQIYIFELVEVRPATDAQGLVVHFSQDGGGTWKTGASYDFAQSAYTSNNAGNNVGGAGSAAPRILSVSNSATYQGVSGSFRIVNPSGTTARKRYFGVAHYADSTLFSNAVTYAQAYTADTAAINGVRWTFEAGNITAGQIYAYGLRTA